MSRFPSESEVFVGNAAATRRRAQFTVSLTEGISASVSGGLAGGQSGEEKHGEAAWPAAKVGGKAQGLRRLVEEGFLVPPAFCVTTDAFAHFTQPLMAGVETLDGLREAIRELSFPPDFVEEITRQLKRLGGDSFAVRSSALEEDQLEHSFAGQQLSVLNVSSPEGVLRAICEVWASLFGLESLLYRAQMGLDVVPRAMGVIVQRMVHPVAGGVMFTVDPLHFDGDEMVISSAAGSAETVVGGGATNTYYLDKASAYVRRHISAAREEEGNKSDEPQDSAGKGVHLTEQQIAVLVEAGRRIEAIFGSPQDIEWAWGEQGANRHEPGRLYFLQTRPITAPTGAAEASSVWTNANVGEALPGVATPLTWSIIHRFSRKGFEQAFGTLGLAVPAEFELVREFRGRVYLNLTQFMTVASGIPLLKPETLFAMAGGGGVDLVRDRYEKRSARRFWLKLPTTVPKIIAAQLSMPVVAPVWGKYFTEKCEEFFDRDLRAVSRERLRAELAQIDRLFDRTGLVMLTTSSNFLMSYVVTRELLRLWGGAESADRERELFGGMQVKSAEPGLALLELGRILRRSYRLRKLVAETPAEQVHATLVAQSAHEDVASFLAALDDFREEYGHRAPREAELSTPRWREDTTFLFEVMKSFVAAPYLASSLQLERERRRAQEVSSEIVQKAFLPGLRQVFELVLKVTRGNAQLREYMRDRVVDSLDIYRRYFLACGHHLVRDGFLREAEDVFYLTYEEIRAWLASDERGAEERAVAGQFAVRVLVRKAVQEQYRNQPDPPDTFLLRGHEMIAEEEIGVRVQTGADENEGVYLELYGLPGSSGRVTGRARVIHDPYREDAVILPGEVLVAPYTDVGWTPLFLTARAVITSLGGPLSHACIVAREYGIPTVVNAKRATEVIQTGDVVTVDGDRGVVYVRRS